MLYTYSSNSNICAFFQKNHNTFLLDMRVMISRFIGKYEINNEFGIFHAWLPQKNSNMKWR